MSCFDSRVHNLSSLWRLYHIPYWYMAVEWSPWASMTRITIVLCSIEFILMLTLLAIFNISTLNGILGPILPSFLLDFLHGRPQNGANLLSGREFDALLDFHFPYIDYIVLFPDGAPGTLSPTTPTKSSNADFIDSLWKLKDVSLSYACSESYEFPPTTLSPIFTMCQPI